MLFLNGNKIKKSPKKVLFTLIAGSLTPPPLLMAWPLKDELFICCFPKATFGNLKNYILSYRYKYWGFHEKGTHSYRELFQKQGFHCNKSRQCAYIIYRVKTFVSYWTWLQSTPFPHMPATALRSGHVRFIVRGQMYDGRLTINTAWNILFNVSYILYFSKYIQISSLLSLSFNSTEVGFNPSFIKCLFLREEVFFSGRTTKRGGGLS